jgi:hypothetical protein
MVKAKKQQIKVTISEEVYRSYDEENAGICLACGEWKFGDCEPDARNYECDACGQPRVYGLMEAFMRGNVVIGGKDEEEAT